MPDEVLLRAKHRLREDREDFLLRLLAVRA
jgi:hypothetical protein